MPLQQPGEEQPVSDQKTDSPQVIDVSLNKKPKRSKKWLWISLVVILILLLVGVGLWVWLAKPFSKESKGTTSKSSATSSSKPETKKEKTKYAYTGSDGNIWVLDVVTKGKIQVTSDGSQSHYYSVGEFIDSDTFSYEICGDSSCEIWLVDLEQNQFEKSQLKKIPVNTFYEVDPNLNILIYSKYDSGEVTIVDLKSSGSDKKLTFDLGVVGGRGGSSRDCFKLEFSPESSKFFLINTMNLESVKIIIWNINGEKLGEITEKLTAPFWTNNNTILYSNWDEGVFTYDLSKDKSTKLNSNKDWTIVDVSSDRKKISYNIGNNFQMMSGLDGDRNVYTYNIETKEEKLVKTSVLGGVWVGNNYLVGGKTRKCAADDQDQNYSCEVGVDCYTAVENTFVVINLQNNTFYE